MNKLYRKTALLVIISGLFVGCNPVQEESTKTVVYETWDIEPKLIFYSNYSIPPFYSTISVEMIQFTKNENSKDTFEIPKSEVVGFTYEEGYRYVISVKRTYDTRIADDMWGENQLIRIISKTKAE